MPFPGGFVMTPDLVTLIVSLPEQAQLIYVDTVEDRIAQRLTVDFQPTALALQGDTLFAATRGSALIYALDVKTAQVKKRFNAGGEAIRHLACHPAQGRLYATSTDHHVYSIDPATGDVRQTAAQGDFIAVDPVDGRFVYTGIQPADRNTIHIREMPGRRFVVSRDTWGPRARLMKYGVEGETLRQVAGQDNAAVNGWWMHLTPDGKRLMFVGGGGWRPLERSGSGGGYYTAVYDTEDLKTMVGQAPHGLNILFHPVLNLGVSNAYSSDLTLFQGRSLVELRKIHLGAEQERRTSVLAFCGQGSKILLWTGDHPEKQQGLIVVPLKLSDGDWNLLAQHYGPLRTKRLVTGAGTPEVAGGQAAAQGGSAAPAASAATAPAPKPARKAAAIAFQPHRPTGGREEVELPGFVGDVTVGGGGRYLIYRLSDRPKLAIFDVQQGKVAKELPLISSVAHLAGGATQLIVVYPRAKQLEVWNLSSFEKETTAPLPAQLTSDAIGHVCMGSASGGPLFVYLPHEKRTLAVDVPTLATTEVRWTVFGPNNAGGPGHMRASADGTVLLGWGGSWAGLEMATFEDGQQLDAKKEFEFSGGAFALPSVNGGLIFTQWAIVTRDLQPMKVPELQQAYLIPAQEPGYFLALFNAGKRPLPNTSPTEGPANLPPVEKVVIYSESLKPLLVINDCQELREPSALHWEKRVHFYPRAGLLITLANNRRLILRHVDVPSPSS
jgi:hypothetical protein